MATAGSIVRHGAIGSISRDQRVRLRPGEVLSMLAAGNGKASPSSLPATTIGVGHSANRRFAAGISLRVSASAATDQLANLLPYQRRVAGERQKGGQVGGGTAGTTMAF